MEVPILPSWQLAALAGAFAILVAAFWPRTPKGVQLPGPPKLPIVGNYLQMVSPDKPFYQKLHEWADQYGPIFVLEAFGAKTFVVSSAEAQKEIFENRGANYSSRYKLPMLGDFVCKQGNIGFLPYGDRWRKHRRAVHRELNVGAFNQYEHIQTREAYYLAQGFLERPTDELLNISQRFGGAIGLGLVYDHRAEGYSDPLVAAFSHVLEGKLLLLVPLASFYDSLPAFLRPVVPEWMMPSKKQARLVREQGEALDSDMSRIVQERVAKGDGVSCFHAGLLQREVDGQAELTPFERDSLSGTLVGAAVDTTTASLLAVVLALVCFPEAQKKMQAAVDVAVPRDRLPGPEDMEKLNYVRAFVLDALRWRSSNRYGLPHAASADDWYNGVFIPKGSTIIMNAWHFEHDPVRFPDHETVVPERYLHSDGSLNTAREVYTFGVGRRVCPGQNLALSSLTMATACLAWSYNFVRAKDAHGREIVPDSRPENAHAGGNVYRPGPFKFAIEHRDPQVERVIRAAVASVA